MRARRVTAKLPTCGMTSLRVGQRSRKPLQTMKSMPTVLSNR